MKIAVNTRLLLKNKLEGIGWFSFETLRRIVVNNPKHEFIFFFDRTYDPSFLFGENVKPVVLFPQARHPFLYVAWFEWSVNKALKKYQADVFLSPDGYLPLRSSTPSVPVIHDLNFEEFPQDFPWLTRNYNRYFFPKFARKGTRVVTVSEFSKKDISSRYGVAPEKIDVVYNGVNEVFGPRNEEVIIKTREKWTGGNPYFIYVGALHPRKNISRMLKAYDLFREKHGQPFRLVLAGGTQWWTSEMREAFESSRFKDEIVFTGHLSTEDLADLVGSAFGMLYLSYFEGFGIPLLEGMKSEIPIIAGNRTSLPEVTGDAAILVDPFSVDAIEKAMLETANDEQKRTQLVEAGKKRVELFSWDNAAKGLMKSIEKATGDAQT